MTAADAPAWTIRDAVPAEAADILALQKRAYQAEADLYDDPAIPPMVESRAALVAEFATTTVLVATVADRIVGAVRARRDGEVCGIGRLIVDPDLQRRGLGSALLRAIEARCADAARYALFTGSRSVGNLRLYRRHGYVEVRNEAVSPTLTLTFLEKSNASREE